MDVEKGVVENTEPSLLPKGSRIFSTFPDMLFIPELIFGGLVLSLIAATAIEETSLIHGWVLCVSLLCFLGTFTIMIVFAAGGHKKRETIWTYVDVYYHFLAAALYLSAGIVNAIGTHIIEYHVFINDILNMSATVSAFLVILMYSVHAASSLKRKIDQAP
ncbi:myelin and lymphocyte protein-like [Rhinoderma darwinii]|uniref:myelin and lymphocyte protein-like n=1 Tax=Rhinoderma darwinii TaxID=43563 RepID=UPI003F669601